MIKKVLSAIMAVAMLIAAMCLVGCGTSTTESTEERLPVTISVLGVTSESTTPEAVQAVEDAINVYMGSTYSTHVDLTFVTMDEYEDLVAERTAEAQYLQSVDKAVTSYNEKAVSNASNSKVTKKFGKWEFVVSEVPAVTVTTRKQYTAIVTEINEHGVLEVVYPEAASPIDVVMVIGQDMYNDFDEADILRSVKSELSTEAYTKFSQFIYPTYLSMLQAITGDVKAIPNNNLIGEYTYLLVRKDISDKYDFDIDTVSDYDDLADLLASIKANETMIPMKSVPDALGIFKLFESNDIAIGTYCDPLLGYNTEEGTSYNIQNLFDIPEYQNYLKLMEEYTDKGYFTSDTGSSEFAVQVVKGDASVEAIYGDEYEVKVLQNPFVESSSIFKGMFAVSNETSNVTRSLEFILELTTNSEIKNLLQYGIEGENYTVNTDGTITRLNNTYMMDNATTGNVYKGYPEEGMLPNQWEYVKETNLDSLIGPYCTYVTKTSGGYSTVYYVDDSKMDELLPDAIKRAVLDDAFKAVGSSYDYYLSAEGTPKYRAAYAVKSNPEYYDYFIQAIISDSKVTETQAKAIFEQNSAGSGAKYSYDWYFDRIIELKTTELYGYLRTSNGLTNVINEKIAALAGVSYTEYKDAQSKASTYYSNIDTLKIMTRIIIWNDLTDEEWEKYENMGAEEFESVVFEYVKENYNKENDIDDEKYDALVKAFIASYFRLTDPSDNSTYTITWDEYMEKKEAGQSFFSVIDKLKELYSADLLSYYGPMFSYLYTDNDVPDCVYEVLYSKWLKENGTTQKEFEDSIYDELLSFAGITYTQLSSYRRSDTTKYTEYISKLKSQYKSILVENFSLAQYKNNNISNDQVLTTLLEVKIEEKTKIKEGMCNTLGMSYSDYENQKSAYETYVSLANQLRTRFIYTLLTVYTQEEINAFEYNEIDQRVYDVIYSTGFYTNEMCQYICTDLSSYMNKKSDIKNYKNYVTKVAKALETELTAAGYTVDEIVGMDIADVQTIFSAIVNEKFYSDSINVMDYLEEFSLTYISQLETTTDVSALIEEAKNAINNDSLFNAIIYNLAEGLATARSAAGN